MGGAAATGATESADRVRPIAIARTDRAIIATVNTGAVIEIRTEGVVIGGTSRTATTDAGATIDVRMIAETTGVGTIDIGTTNTLS